MKLDRPTPAPRLAILAGLLSLIFGPPAGACPLPAGAPAGPTAQAASGTAAPVYFIGLDGADWQLLDRFIAAGSMPNLARLVAEGSSGILASENPPLSPILWTTMMTGVSPLEHRILDFTRFSPATGVREPIGSEDRRAPAVWNIASWAGQKVGVFGMWATFPAEEIRGVLVSDRLSSFLGPRGAAPEGAVSPDSFLPAAKATRDRIEREVGLAEMRQFLPGLQADEFERAKATESPYAGPVPGLWRMLVETRLQDALFQEFVRREKPGMAILYLEATDIAGHLFASYFPPRLPTTPAADFERFQGVPERFYAWIDFLLGQYAALARENGATLMLASDHGFHWQEGRPERTSSLATATAAHWHRDDGIFLLHGPGIPARPRTAESSGIRRVAATLLALAGIAPGLSIEGPPLPPVSASMAPSAPPEDYGRRFRAELRAGKAKSPASTPANVPAAEEELAKLRSLGYLGESEVGKAPEGVRDTRSPGSYNNEGVLLRDLDRHDEAIAAFERAIALDPKFASAEWNLSESLWRIGQHDRADALLRSALAHDLGDGRRNLAKRVNQRLKIGRASLEAGACQTALGHFEAAAALAPVDPMSPAAAGLAHLCMGDEKRAAALFRRSLELDPKQPKLRSTLDRLEGNHPAP